jgi:hypothetical protein
MKESELEKICINYVSSYSTIAWWKVKAGGQKHSFGGKSFFKKSTIPGFPDLLLCIQGKFIGIELKSDIGRQSDVQKICQQRIENSCGLYYIVRSINELKQIVEKYI